ncbi:hybrid sensor histidine kinase/response regulator [Psychrobacter jeotgali]|uniref:hybrid sensor histidine kinase/response regulator n=1 Tax=Psychrobacter jeotgali TaxID=179010 RepID=UPI00191A12D5|nr:response regulator [Psychrobacter jeotgali]
MQQFQSLIRLLFFYTLTLLIMLFLYYSMLFNELKNHSQHHTVMIFESLQHEITEHITPSNDELEEILTKPFMQDVSYQLILMLPSGQTYIHRHTQPYEATFNTVAFPTLSLPSSNISAYEINSRNLKGVIKLESGHQLYVVLRHQTTPINWISYQYWLPVMTAIFLFILALLYMLKRRTNWEQLLQYTEQLTTSSKKTYAPLPLTKENATSEFMRLGHALSRVSYQLHYDYRRVQTLMHRLERLVDQSPLPMLMVMRQGQVSFFNKRFEQVFATSFQKGNQYLLTDFVMGSDKSTQQLLQNLSTQRVTRTLLVKNIVNQQTYQLHMTPWFGEHGQVHGFTVLINNIDEFRRQIDTMQLQIHGLQMQINEFAKLRSIIGHELRTPLNAIIGTLDLIEPHTSFTEQQELITTLKQSSYSMLTMLNDMLDMAKIEAGKTSIANESADIYKITQQVSDLMVGSARRHEIELLYFFTPDCPRYITTDANRLRQILLNLMDNAIKFTHSGYVALLIEPVSKNNVEHQWIRFKIKDTGIGIDKNEQQHLFSYFNQANAQIGKNFGGTGLGLAISNSFAQLLGGFIELESDGHTGSTFSLYLPCRQPIYQPVYHFRDSLARLHLTAILYNTLCVGFFEQLCSYLSISANIYHANDMPPIEQIKAELTNSAGKLVPVLLIDQKYHDNITQSNDNNAHAFDDLLTSSTVPKLLLSMKTERSIPFTFLKHFDGFLNKPLDVTLLLSELIRLTQPLNAVEEDKSSAIDEEDRVEHNKIESTPQNHAESLTVKPLVLIVDDNKTNQTITSKLLSKLGYPSIVANDGQQALEKLKLQRAQIALILMDYRMPVMDGLQATKIIRAQGDDIPIVALTANNTAEDYDAGMAAGMNTFLEKPINKDQLGRILQQFMTYN